MLKNKFVVLVLALVGLAAAAVFLEKHETQKEAAKYTHINLQPSRIQTLRIERLIGGQAEVLSFKRATQGWLIENQTMSADSEYIKELIEKIQYAEFEEVILNASQPLEQFRFDKPAVQITLTDDLNHTQTLIMSDRKNFEGHPYFKLNQDSKVYTSADGLETMFLNKLIFFQNKHVFQGPHGNFRKIEIRSLNHQFDVLKIPKVDKTKMTAFVDKIKALTVQSYIPRSQKIKLVPPVMEVTLIADDVTWSLKMSLDPTDKKLYAYAQNEIVEYDTSYWAYFSNLSEQQFLKDSQ